MRYGCPDRFINLIKTLHIMNVWVCINGQCRKVFEVLSENACKHQHLSPFVYQMLLKMLTHI